MSKQSDTGSPTGEPQFPALPSPLTRSKPSQEPSAGIGVKPVRWNAPEIPGPTDAGSTLSLPPRPDSATAAPPETRAEGAASAGGTKARNRSRRSRRASSSPKVDARAAPAAQSRILFWLAGMLLCGALFFALGLAAGIYRAAPAEVVEPPEAEGFAVADEDEEKMLNRAFALLREGDGADALRAFQDLRKINPRLASMSYAAALSALQSGDIAAAMAETDASLAKGERVSDSYALAAAVESLKPGSVEWQALGDPGERGEYFLRQAIAADQANPAPRLELGIRLRSKGENAEAAEMLESARLRLHPVDQAAVVDTTLLLIALEQTATAALPADLDPDKSTASLIGAAYVTLRRGDIAAAADLLATAKSRLAPELYYYLLGDPALRQYAAEPQLTPLFQ